MKLIELAKSKGFTFQMLAEKSGVTARTLSNINNGGYCGCDSIKKISETSGITAIEIIAANIEARKNKGK